MNNLPSTDARGMNLSPFDSSRNDDSDDMYFKFLWSLDGELSQINFFAKYDVFADFFNFAF